MKKYFKPTIHTGIDAIYSLSIGLETWTQYLNPVTIPEDKPQMVLAAKILHEYCYQQKFKGWF